MGRGCARRGVELSAGRIRVGMSGFSYPSWVGSLYPAGTRPRDMLAAYAARFDAVEINMTYRRRPRPELLDRWRRSVGDGFRFALKANVAATFVNRPDDALAAAVAFSGVAKELGDHLGPVYVQTPAAFDPARVETYLSGLPTDVAWAIEGRHRSFADAAVGDLLRRHGVARCATDASSSYVPTGPVCYLRFRRGTYGPAELERIADDLSALAGGGRDVYAFFRHEDRPEAPDPALALAALLA